MDMSHASNSSSIGRQSPSAKRLASTAKPEPAAPKANASAAHRGRSQRESLE
jgi:hypothetical protein